MNQQMQTLQRQAETAQAQEPETTLIPAKTSPSSVAMTNNGLRPSNLEEAWRYAMALSRSAFVPATYQQKPDDCLIAIDMAQRLNVAPLMFLQNTYVVHGRPGMEAKLVIALVNASGLFVDPLDYEVEGDNPNDKAYRVRAFAARSKTGKVIYGPWITWAIVSGEGWDKNDGSKWKTMPSMMFLYRSAAWFARTHCPEVTMGMLTLDELDDMAERKPVAATVLEGKARGKFGLKSEPKPEPVQEQGPTEPEPVVEPDADSQLPPEETDPPEQQEWLYHCTECGNNFDEPKIIDPKGRRLTGCPQCKSIKLVDWQEWVITS